MKLLPERCEATSHINKHINKQEYLSLSLSGNDDGVQGVDNYLECCKQLGWKPNGRRVKNKEAARNAVKACGYQIGLSVKKVEQFTHEMAVYRWNRIDDGNCVYDLLKKTYDDWWREDPDAVRAEQRRRVDLAAARAAKQNANKC